MQKMITGKSLEDLAKNVNYLLERGATVVPGTVASVVDPNSIGPPTLNPFYRRVADVHYVCTLEMSDDVFKKLDAEEKATEQAKQDAVRDQRRKERRETIHAQQVAAKRIERYEEAIKEVGGRLINVFGLSEPVYRKLRGANQLTVHDIMLLDHAKLKRLRIGPEAISKIEQGFAEMREFDAYGATLKDDIHLIDVDADAVDWFTDKELQAEIDSGKLS